MKVTFLEPLGIPQEQLKAMVESSLGELVEATYYDTRAEDAETLTERSKGADCVVLSNIRYGEDIISQLPDLKMICVAFTGVDLIEMWNTAGPRELWYVTAPDIPRWQSQILYSDSRSAFPEIFPPVTVQYVKAEQRPDSWDGSWKARNSG